MEAKKLQNETNQWVRNDEEYEADNEKTPPTNALGDLNNAKLYGKPREEREIIFPLDANQNKDCD